MGSVVSPSLSSLVQDNAELTGLRDPNHSKKKKKGYGKESKEEEGYEDTSKGSREDTLAMLLNMTLELQSQIRTMQEDVQLVL